MKSMKAKTKAKKPNGKFGKVKFSSKEVTPIHPDLTQLSQPIDTSVSNLYRAIKVLENGSDEVKSILTYECDLIYECRICRSLFRSLVNFISHKRSYCTEKFDVTCARNPSNNYIITSANELNQDQSEKLFQEICGNDRILRSQTVKEKEKKDLTSVVDMLQKKQIKNLQSNNKWVCLESVQSNPSAVYQTVESVVSNQDHKDLMKTQITELADMKTGKIAVLDTNGQVVRPIQASNCSSISHSSNKEGTNKISENDLICSICHTKFSTKKTLAVHTRTLHTSHRLCYPCPYCSNTFANTWSVYRHLFKVHRKSNEQVRKLRSQIQEKAFIKDTTAAEDLQKEDANKTLINDTLQINETQEWMDHLESDTELQRCGGCGKRFDRKAALSSHSQYCHRRVAAYEGTSKVKKVNKVSPDPTPKENLATKVEIQTSNQDAEDSSIICEINNSNETSIRVEAVASLSKADWDMLTAEKSVSETEVNEGAMTVLMNGTQETIQKNNGSFVSNTSEPVEILYTNITKKTNLGSRKRKTKQTPKRLNNISANVTKGISLEVNTEQDIEVKKLDHMLLMEEKVASIINLQKLQCLSCKRKFMSVTNLRRHAAIHIGWNRYQCKLCDFKCFVKCDCVAHCNKMHNAQNNRVIIEDMITPIPDDHYTRDQGIMLDITNIEKESDTPEIIEERVESKVQMEEKIVNKTNEEVTDTIRPIVQEIVHVNTEAQQALNINNKEENTLGLDPDVRKMVMEVIFGPLEVNSTKQVETKEAIFVENSDFQLQNRKDKETQSKCPGLKESGNTFTQDNSKPQRPIRNKIKSLNKDFIYDLKEATFRKDSLIMKPFSKSLGKKSSVSDEDTLDKDIEQSSKRFKSIKNGKISILCENSVIDKCDIKLNTDLKSSLTFSQCHS